MKELELLAPAGNPESFDVAINNGANAIYLGLNAFNARGNIENFNQNNLRESVKKAHLFGVRVFVTLNTLICDDEVQEVLNLVRMAIDAKVDAFIVQDIGLAYLLRKKFPNIELHASTQMGIQNIEAVKFLSPLKYKRVVLARETPLNEIKRIKENSNVEIEYFVQGALCVSFSGNCYLCSLYANASGNRGKCKQFCRLPISCEGANGRKEGYLLSTKDFCMLPKLKDLAQSGVTSLKIEGRARRTGYVGGVVNVYRKVIDNNFNFTSEDIINLKKLFNRGNFACGYLDDENIIYNKTQNHMGVKIGKVVWVKNGKKFNEIKIQSTHNLCKGDSLKFFDKEREVCSLNVQDVQQISPNQYLFTTTTKVPPNADAHLILDSQFEKEIMSNKKKIGVHATFIGNAGENAILKLKADDVEITQKGDVLQQASSSPLTEGECFNQLSKMGEEFSLTSLDFNGENVFIAKSQLNALRREATLKLKEKIILKNEEKLKIDEVDFQLKLNHQNGNKKDILYFSSLKTLEKYINNTNYLVFNPNEYNIKEIEDFCNKYPQKIIYLSLPIICNQNMLNILKDLYKKVQNLGVVATNYYCFSLTSPQKTIVGSDMNVANSYAVEFYQNLGYDKIILSKEDFNFSNIKSDAQLFIENNFKKNLMHFKHCPFKENLNSTCQNCKYKEGATYKLNGKQFAIIRKKLGFCQFILQETSPIAIQNGNFGNVNMITN